MSVSMIDNAIMTFKIYLIILGLVCLFFSVNKKGAVGDVLVYSGIGLLGFYSFIAGATYFTGVDTPLSFLVSEGSILFWIGAALSGLLVAVLPYSLIGLGLVVLNKKVATSAKKGLQ